jgi:DNA polymerase III subunit delta
VIVKGPAAEKALSSSAPDWTLALLYGPDEAGSRALADRFATAMGADAERIDLDGATLKDDPARLPDEANAMTMFGGPRWIRVTGGDECLRAVEALLDAPKGAPVVLVAGNLPKTSALAKLGSDARILAVQSWLPTGDSADRVAQQTAAPLGVKLSGEAARMLAEATHGDRALMLREIEKLALYVDAAPDRPRAVERADIEAVGAAIDVREPWTLVDAMFDGHVAALAGELAGEAAPDAIPSLRLAARRAINIARTHAARRGGGGPRVANKERESIDRQARTWSPAMLVKAHTAVMDAEAAIKMPGNAGEVVASQEMLRMARVAERRR